MSTGWAIWDVAGIHMHHRPRTSSWMAKTPGGPGTSDEQSPRSVPRDMFIAWATSGQPSSRQRTSPSWHPASPPASVAYTARCWAASELLECLEPRARAVTAHPGEELFRALSQTHPGFMPPRTPRNFALLAEDTAWPEHLTRSYDLT